MFEPDSFHDLLVFGAELEDLSKPFLVGNLAMYPKHDVRKALGDLNQDAVRMAVRSRAVYSKYRESVNSELAVSPLSPEDLCLIPFRLFKDGWISAIPIGPEFHTRVRRIYQALYAPRRQRVYAPKKYVIRQADLPGIQAICHKLTYVPEGYLESALKRFGRAYDYWIDNHLADCVDDLVIALESIASREGDSNHQTLSLRTALLIGDNLYDRVQARTEVKKLYEARSLIARRQGISDKGFYESFPIAEDSLNLVRAVIRASIDILGIPPSERASLLPDTMEMVIDNYLFDALRSPRSL